LRKAADYGKERLVLLRRFPLEQALGLPSIIGKFSVLQQNSPCCASPSGALGGKRLDLLREALLVRAGT
jgi:hypothetical protein